MGIRSVLMKRAPSNISWLVLVSVSSLALVACNESMVHKAPPPPPPAPEAPKAPAKPEPTGPVDHMGNLRPSPEQVFGFDLPLASMITDRDEDQARGTVSANEERLLRFYRSRGHALTKTVSGWEVRHGPRTLRGQGADGAALAAAYMELRPGPGPGYSLFAHRGTLREPKRPALVELLEAERALGARDPANAEPAPPRSAEEQAKLERLREKAMRRPLDKRRRSRDISKRIRDYARDNPDEQFLD